MIGVAGELTAITPARILDTRDGTGRGGVVGKLVEGQRLEVLVTGVGGVPATQVDSVVLNVTVDETTAPSWLAVWPSGREQPVVSNLNYVAGQTVPNLVTVKVGANGRVSLAHYRGSTHVVFDVVGWYAATNGAAGEVGSAA